MCKKDISEMGFDLSEQLKNNDRYFISIFAVLILSLLLLFFKDLTPFMKEKFVPSFVVYLVGTVLLAQIQNMVGNRAILKQGTSFKGTHQVFFWGIVLLHVIWFSLFIWYLLINNFTNYA
jgi:hypothetical protein